MFKLRTVNAGEVLPFGLSKSSGIRDEYYINIPIFPVKEYAPWLGVKLWGWKTVMVRFSVRFGFFDFMR